MCVDKFVRLLSCSPDQTTNSELTNSEFSRISSLTNCQIVSDEKEL